MPRPTKSSGQRAAATTAPHCNPSSAAGRTTALPPANSGQRRGVSTTASSRGGGGSGGSGRGGSRIHQTRPRGNKDSSRRRTAHSASFPLLSSASHSFAITRRFKDQYTFAGIDAPVSWSAVRLVTLRTHLHQHSGQEERCPICLDDFVAARITKCGHVFCLPCLIHHVQSSAMLNPYRENPLCPCCASDLHLDDVRPVVIRSVAPPLVDSRLTLIKLHRVKGCASPYLPYLQYPKRSAPSSAPLVSDLDAPYSKFQYIDAVLLRKSFRDDLRALESAAAAQTNDEAGRVCLTLARDFVQRELRRWEDEAPAEAQLQTQFANPASGMYQRQSAHLCYNISDTPPEESAPATASSNLWTEPLSDSLSQLSIDEKPESSHHTLLDIHLHSQPCPSNDIAGTEATTDSSPTSPTYRTRGDSIVSLESRVSSRHSVLSSASMYLDADECAFYQAADGTLCFLSAFNMRCLQAEYSLYLPDSGTDKRGSDNVGSEEVPDSTATGSNPKLRKPSRQRAPLPDVVEGRVLEAEHLTLTPHLRDRMRFLEHVPLYTDVCLVELGLGHLLSKATKKQCQAEFFRRQHARTAKAKSERREDRRERLREEKRVQELKNRYQRVDPNDEFFHVSVPETLPNVLGEEFGPSLTPTTEASPTLPSSPADPIMSFSQVCRRSEVILNRETEFPALGAAPPPPAPPPRLWRATPTVKDDGQQTTAASSTWGVPTSSAVARQPVHAGPEAPKSKRNGGKKIVLLSTGGRHGLS